ncbi:MAG: 2-hydroxyacyl-CoA dehydratase, partial [Candidatus Coatesbacteria bacterium]
IYDTARAAGLRRLLVVTGGDCSNAAALGEVWEAEGFDVITFSFPPRPDAAAVAEAVAELAQAVGTTAEAAEAVYRRFAPTRALLAELDELTWREGRVTGRENFDWLLRACDFAPGVETFEAEARTFREEALARPPREAGVRLGLAGVPSINGDLLEYLEELGAAVVYNELPRQFALLGGGDDLAGAYAAYTYPYGVGLRLADLRAEAERRNLHGLVHYVQSFCYRGIHDILLRRELELPILTVEGERPGPLSAQQRLRLETFVDVARRRIS